MFRRPGKGLPIDSWVFRPIIIVCPQVVSLNRFCSPGRCQGIWLFWPITLLDAIAAISIISMCYRVSSNNAYTIGKAETCNNINRGQPVQQESFYSLLLIDLDLAEGGGI